MNDVSVRRRGVFHAMGLCLLVLPGLASAKEVVGFVEKVTLYPGGLQVKAKVDTGAFSTSLHCTTCDKTFKRDGQDWVRFTVTNWRGESVEIERPVVGRTTITRHFGTSQERLVITLPVCLDGVIKQKKVNVVDRTGFNYQMLIGRNFLRGDFLVDPGEKYLASKSCPDAAQTH